MKSSRASGGKSMSPRTRSWKRMFSPGGEEGGGLLRRTIQAGAGIEEGDPLGLRRDALGVELLRGAEAAVGEPLVEELLGAGAVEGQALALEERPLVPLDADPGESR